MIRVTRPYNEIAHELMDNGFTPEIIIFKDDAFGTITVRVHSIAAGTSAYVSYIAQKIGQPAFLYSTLKEAFNRLGIK